MIERDSAIDLRRASRRARRHLAEITPILAIIMMLVLPRVLRTEALYSDEAVARNEQIAKVIDRVPWIVADRWSGRSVPIPVAATRILRPTAILSRRYRALPLSEDDPLDGVEATLVVVHCSDMRDMQGHYPPVCYPAQGWRPVVERTVQLTLESTVLGRIQLSRYVFEYGGSFEPEYQKAVLNCFIMPDGGVAANLDQLNRMKRRRATSLLGAAQVQLVVDHTLDDESSLQVLQELIDGMPAVFSLLAGDLEEPSL